MYIEREISIIIIINLIIIKGRFCACPSLEARDWEKCIVTPTTTNNTTTATNNPYYY